MRPYARQAAGTRTLELLDDARNYSHWTYDRLSAGLGRRVLEVGCGTGTITRLLLDRELVWRGVRRPIWRVVVRFAGRFDHVESARAGGCHSLRMIWPRTAEVGAIGRQQAPSPIADGPNVSANDVTLFSVTILGYRV